MLLILFDGSDDITAKWKVSKKLISISFDLCCIAEIADNWSVYVELACDGHNDAMNVGC